MRKAMIKRFRKAHRIAGIFLSLFLIIIAVSGVMVNHAALLGLDKTSVPAFIAGWYYRDALSSVSGYRVTEGYVYSIGTEVYLNRTLVTDCAQGLSGATTVSEGVIALCTGDLLVVSPGGRLVERLGSVHGVPDGVERLGHAGGGLVLGMSDTNRGFDPDTLETIPAPANVSWQQAVRVPAALTRASLADAVSWEQFVLDLHSGRLFGASGAGFVDGLAALLVLMAVSGVLLWRAPRRDNGCKSSDQEIRQ
jgi:hypothetical protein